MDEQKPEEVKCGLEGSVGGCDTPQAECDCHKSPEVVQPVAETPKEPELTPEQVEKMEKQKKFFNYLRAGAAFIQFVEKDLEQMRKQKMNRHFRRRAEKEIRKGFLSPELVNMYAEKMEEIVIYIEVALAKQGKKVEEKIQENQNNA